MGIGPNWHGTGTANPAFARERYREAHDLLIKAMTDPGPFEWIGRFYHLPYVNLWPKPLQRPHPPVFIPAAGSKETLELCAKNDYVYQAVLVPRKVLLRNCELFRQLRTAAGRPEDPKKIAAVLNVHVAETDEQARRECEPYVMWNYQNGLRSRFPDSFPPGHVSVSSLRGMTLGGGYRSRDMSELTWDEILQEGWVVAGSPETVSERIEELTGEMGAGRVIIIPDFFVMPSWLVRKSLGMFAEDVIPRFRAAGGKPVWATRDPPGYETIAEYGARAQEPKAIPTARIHGTGVVDLRTAHIPELRIPLRD
jgi:alkanesulfonate monooxygenase SsuD/methylene tetrahydromethanopterin reductase-like flavin-dependent oxidoreductase (luciferase family)